MKQLNEATYFQAEASDQWSYYQAKGIKQNLYELDRDRLVAAHSTDTAALSAVNGRVERYEKRKQDIAATAKRLESQRDSARESATRSATASREFGWRRPSFKSRSRWAVSRSS